MRLMIITTILIMINCYKIVQEIKYKVKVKFLKT